MSLAGMNSLDLSDLSTFQQLMIFFLMIFGSQIFVSFLVVQFRKRAFQVQFRKSIEDQEKRKEVGDLSADRDAY